MVRRDQLIKYQHLHVEQYYHYHLYIYTVLHLLMIEQIIGMLLNTH